MTLPEIEALRDRIRNDLQGLWFLIPPSARNKDTCCAAFIETVDQAISDAALDRVGWEALETGDVTALCRRVEEA